MILTYIDIDVMMFKFFLKFVNCIDLCSVDDYLFMEENA